MEPRHEIEIAKLVKKREEVIESEQQLNSEKEKLIQLELTKEQNEEICQEQEQETRINREQATQMQPEIDNLKKELAEHESIRDELQG